MLTILAEESSAARDVRPDTRPLPKPNRTLSNRPVGWSSE